MACPRGTLHGRSFAGMAAGLDSILHLDMCCTWTVYSVLVILDPTLKRPKCWELSFLSTLTSNPQACNVTPVFDSAMVESIHLWPCQATGMATVS